MNPIKETRALLRKQYAAMMETAGALMVLLEAEAKATNTCNQSSISTIQQIVAEHFKLSPSVMSSRIRSETYVAPRHIAMVLSRELTPHSLSVIGGCFLRDHGTVVHATKSITNRMQVDAAFAETYRLLFARCQNALLGQSMPLFDKSP